MIAIDFEQLRRIGLNQAITNELFQLDVPEGSRLVRVTEVQRDRVGVHDGAEEATVRILPRLLHALEEGDALATGDWALAQCLNGEWWLSDRVPPQSRIARRANDGRRQPLASNIDTALLVMGLDRDFNLRRMERYVALVQASAVSPVAVLTKRDIASDADEKIAGLQQRLPASVPVLAVNGLELAAREALAAWLAPGQTLVVLGSSGAGKSTLTNTLTASDAQLTGAVRKGDGRGRHTTTARSLHLCPDGACIIDTPGLRTWRPDADEAALAATFEDIESLAAHCQFRNCRHEQEPGCAVRAAIPPDRLLNYQKLLRDAARGSQTPLERIALRAKWKALGKAGAERAKEKRR